MQETDRICHAINKTLISVCLFFFIFNYRQAFNIALPKISIFTSKKRQKFVKNSNGDQEGTKLLEILSGMVQNKYSGYPRIGTLKSSLKMAVA